MRIGHGWDRHMLITERLLVLGGTVIPHHLGEDGHSDDDVLLHAIMDALLGAACLDDIGTHFPPGVPEWKNADSTDLLTRVYDLVQSRGYGIVNIDATVILETPRLGPYILKIRERIADLLCLAIDQVSVKAKTAEGVPPVGSGEAIEAYAVVLLEDDDQSIYL